MRKLISEIDNLIPELVDDLGVVADVKLHVKHISLHYCLYLFCPVSVLQCVECVFVRRKRRAYVCNHYSATVSAQRVLQQPSQLRVSVGYVLILCSDGAHLCLLTESIDAVTQSQQTFINVGTFD